MTASPTDRKSGLLAELSTAAAQERSAWHVLNDPQLDEAERAKAYAIWQAAAALVKVLAIKIQAADADPPVPDPPDPAPPSQ